MAVISLKDQVRRFKLSLSKKLFEAALGVEAKMHELVAVDTGRLDKSIGTDKVIDRGNILSVDVGANKVHYAVYVDQGVQGKIFNYHKRSGASRPIIYTGHGQKWIERSILDQQSEISAKILQARVYL